MTLFAFLGVIRQAHDNFTIEKTSDEILSLIGKFGNEWIKYTEQLGKLKRRFSGMEKDFEELTGPRQRKLEQPLRDLDAIRQQRNLPVDAELFAREEALDDETPPSGNVRHLGA
jgi:DNA recombination protein RmuC